RFAVTKDKLCIRRIDRFDILQHFYPIMNRSARRSIGIGIHPIKDQISGMHNVRLLKIDYSIAAGMGRSVVSSANGFISDLHLPTFGKGNSWIGWLRLVLTFLGSFFHQEWYIFVGYHLFGKAFEDWIPGGMIAVMVRIN